MTSDSAKELAPECWNCGALASDAPCTNCHETDPLRDLKRAELDDKLLAMPWDELSSLVIGYPRKVGAFTDLEDGIQALAREAWRVHVNNPQRKAILERLRSILDELDEDDLTCLELSRVVPWADLRGVALALRVIDDRGKQTQLGRAALLLHADETSPIGAVFVGSLREARTLAREASKTDAWDDACNGREVVVTRIELRKADKSGVLAFLNHEGFAVSQNEVARFKNGRKIS